MSKINLLSSKIYNRISAGEVVDRPYSVVKELVENSIDAGATSINIDIENGGISSIVITDNGSGIEKSELKKAILPHATSKISSLKDLDNICSLGFRGEALASIASVSKLKIESKTENQNIGAFILVEGGEIIDSSDCGCSVGTTVTVKTLFYNTPAREKFLRSSRSEESDISSTVARFILGNPNIAFKYTADGKTIYQSFGDGLESAMVNVYGPDVISDCFFIDTQKNGFTIKGYLGKHHFTKGNRSHQTVFINGRYVVNQTISSAISNAYSSYLMKHRYPFYVLNVSMPTSTVDINVHPNKLEVRFSNNQIVYGTIYSVVSKVLDGISEALNIVTPPVQKEPFFKQEKSNIPNEKPYNFTSQTPSFSSFLFSDIKPQPQQDNSQELDIFAENKAYIEKIEKERQQTKETQEQLIIATEQNLKFIGQALNTFLILEDGQDLYLVDQHAAHERLLFDKLISLTNNKKFASQPLLIPFVLNVNNEEFDFINQNIFS
ncbi:MAG: DNA mismatch repair endonuclease MutL, partial [Clostridia bacterium]|nr:DNA mismatch repair endonuclease MutL [Clostridia bacterium]